MKRLKFVYTNNKRIMFGLSFALLLLVTNTLTGTSSLQFLKPAMAKKGNNLITTDDIADDAVTSAKIKDGEVKTSDIADGTITGDDVSPAFMIRKTLLDDDAGHSHNYDPDGSSASLNNIIDSDVTVTKFVHIINSDLRGGSGPANCQVIRIQDGGFSANCDFPLPDGSPLRYIIIDLPEHVVTSVLPSSASSLSTMTSPFNSLVEH